MKRLNRPEAGPACLKRFKHGVDNWQALDDSGYKPIVNHALWEMQDGLCAYCECELKGERGHRGEIEHFRTRSSKPQLTFEWSNLYLSCHAMHHCAEHKDNAKGGKGYSADELIDPAAEDPDDVLTFRESGDVAPREGLDAAARHRAETTIRVLNLEYRKLREKRRGRARIYRLDEPDVVAILASWSPEERMDYVRAELQALHKEPFSAAIRQLLKGLL